MKSQTYELRDELDKGLKKYGEDNNLSPISIIEDLVEDFLCSKDYLEMSFASVPSKPEKIKNAFYREDRGVYEIQKSLNGKRHYGNTKSPVIAKEIVSFLKTVNWDKKYTTKKTGLKGDNQINFLLEEMEKMAEE